MVPNPTLNRKEKIAMHTYEVVGYQDIRNSISYEMQASTIKKSHHM